MVCFFTEMTGFPPRPPTRSPGMGLVPKRLPSSEMGGLGEPRQTGSWIEEQGGPINIESCKLATSNNLRLILESYPRTYVNTSCLTSSLLIEERLTRCQIKTRNDKALNTSGHIESYHTIMQSKYLMKRSEVRDNHMYDTREVNYPSQIHQW
jgi:hypothetical protein